VVTNKFNMIKKFSIQDQYLPRGTIGIDRLRNKFNHIIYVPRGNIGIDRDKVPNSGNE
jgi:hypothetical protein